MLKHPVKTDGNLLSPQKFIVIYKPIVKNTAVKMEAEEIKFNVI